MNRAAQDLIALAGRCGLAWLFIHSGYNALTATQATANTMQRHGIPAADILVWAVIAFELLAGAALVIGLKTRWVAVLLALFVAATAVIFHAYWAIDFGSVAEQKIHFFKNLSILGGLLMVVAFGPGSLSVDGRSG